MSLNLGPEPVRLDRRPSSRECVGRSDGEGPGSVRDVEPVRQLPPEDTPVIPLATPVIAFGDPGPARVATIGINPSAREFLEDGRLLAGSARRLATLPSLAAERLDELTDAQADEVLEECASYFSRNPYRQWFDQLDDLIGVACDASYYDGSACHLDLVPWATGPAWGQIEASARERLLAAGVPLLGRQLDRYAFDVVLLNGRGVIEEILAAGLAELSAVGELRVGGVSSRLYRGASRGATWVAWSSNLQSSRGITNTFRTELAQSVRGILATESISAEATAPADGSAQLVTEGYLPVGARVTGKRELFELLRGWLSESSAATIGDVGTFGGRPGLVIKVGRHEVALNADTTRQAVQAYVLKNSSHPNQPWRVIRNRRGRINKVLPGPDREPLPGWFAYLREPLPEEGYI
jgi:hypothetical protein